MSESKGKTPEQISDEDYKVAPTSADERHLNKKSRYYVLVGKIMHCQTKRKKKQ